MKECRDCKYCEVIKAKEVWMDHCHHPDAVFTLCSFERDDLGSVCKEAGYLFEEK